MSFKKKKHNWWGVIIFQESHLTQTYHEGLLKLQSKEYDKAQELLESVLKDPLIANAQVFPFLFVELLCATVFVLWLIQFLYSLTMVLVIQAADGKSSDGHLLQLRLTHNVHTFAFFFFWVIILIIYAPIGLITPFLYQDVDSHSHAVTF